MGRSRVDGLTIVGLAFLLFFGFNVLRDQGLFSGLFDAPSRPLAYAASAKSARLSFADGAIQDANPDAEGQVLIPLTADSISAAAQEEIVVDPSAIIFPYAHYTLTQGPHGMDYGHMAIDLTAGNGAPILAPIGGIVTAVFIDEYNNTNLILENERYTVTLLHGNYTVQTGQNIQIGQVVGAESNNGYTLDAYGQPCAGRDCGYHTHLNVYDKLIFSNVNPLEVLKPAPPSAQ